MKTRPSFVVALVVVGTFLAPSFTAAGEGGDILIGEIDETVHWTVDGAIDGVRAYSFGNKKCNGGVDVLDWFFTPNPNHPVTTTNLYRIHNGRFEHIGMSWVFHQFFALQSNACEFGCTPECGGNCLGTGCSSGNTAASSGQSGFLGPRSDIDAHRGTNPGAFVSATGDDALSGRLQVHLADTDPFLNINAAYFVEAHSVAADDAQSGAMQFDNNNASYRPVFIDHISGTMSLMGTTQRELSAIYAWQAADPEVNIAVIDIPDEGRLLLGSRVTDLGDGQWHYEYALYNMNSDRSVGAVSVPIEADRTVSNIGFHDVDYHSGELYDGTDWAGVATAQAVTWATTPVEENPLTNALRWGTVYNFRFDADVPPVESALTIGLFKPGMPASVTVAAPAPAAAGGCAAFADCADVDDDGVRDDNCRWWACAAGACHVTDIRFGDMGGPFGACAADGAVDGNDRFHALNCFGNVDVDQQPGYPCEDGLPNALNVDAGGPFGECTPDGVCDGSDAFHALNAFEGASPCGCPLDGGPQPEAPFAPQRVAARASFRTSATVVRPGAEVEVDVFLDTPLEDLRGYQLHVDSRGGQHGALILRDITTRRAPRTTALARLADGRRSRAAHVFDGQQPWTAFNVATRQMVAGLDTPGIAVDSGYLATFVFQASKDAHGTFAIELLSDHTDPSQRTFFFATNPTTRITVAAQPVKITVTE